MQFFLANLYSERLTGAGVAVTEDTTPTVATVVDDARVVEAVLVGSR